MGKAEIAFRLTDTNKDGYIDKAEFAKMAKSLSSEKIDKVFENCDKNKDGKLDLSEFKEMMDAKKKNKDEVLRKVERENARRTEVGEIVVKKGHCI